MINKKNIKISIIVPYFNEEKSIIKTLLNIRKQKFRKFEVITVNSSSTDRSSTLVKNFIKKNKLKNFKNLDRKTIYPSDSKNLGIKNAKYNFVAFMDCDLSFKKNWLKDQIKFMDRNKLEFSLGILKSSSNNNFDKAVISQTWGLNKMIPVIPGSVIKKKMFKKYGKFQVSRAGYDRLWIEKLKKNILFKLNNNNIIKYNKTIHPINYLKLFRKISLYSFHSGKFYFKKVLIYLIFFLSLITTSLYLESIFPALIYFLLRIIFPFYKSKIFLKDLKISFLCHLLPVGIVIDIARFLGYFRIIFNRIF